MANADVQQDIVYLVKAMMGIISKRREGGRMTLFDFSVWTSLVSYAGSFVVEFI